VGGIAQQIHNTRIRLVYPDVVTLTIQDALGNDKQFLVDGTYLAAALAGRQASTNIDVATPWTGARIVGFDQLARRLDAVEQNQIAVQGVTVLEQRGSVIRVRQGLTTDMTNILTKLPTIITIADEVQRSARRDLDRFIGIKFLPGVLSAIEGQLSTTLKSLKSAEIIAAYTGIQARTTNDPTAVDVRACYMPVFPFLYILCTFGLRSSLNS
jgi:magnesium-transporting ATPase (P-type)